MKISAILSTLLLCSLGATSAARAATELAKVGSTVITVEDFTKKYKENLKFFQYKAPSKTSVLDDLVKRELGIQEAKREGLDKDPEIQERMNTVLYHALLDKRLSKEFEAIHVSDGEAKDYYARNPEIRTSHIFVALRPDATAEDVKKARGKIEKIQADLKAGKMSFAEVAQRFSEGVAAPMGGDIDFQTKDKLDPVYYDTSVKLGSVGATSGIVRSQFGLHIIKLTGKRTWDEADKPQVKRLVFEDRRNQIFEKFMTQLRSKGTVTVHNDLIKE